MAFEITKDPNLEIDKERGLVKVQDKNVQQPYNASEFVHRINRIMRFMKNKDDGTPVSAYRNVLIEDTDLHNKLLDSFDVLAIQFTYLTGALKVRGLPVIFPDVEAFEEKFAAINQRTYTNEDYIKIMRAEAFRFRDAVQTSIDENVNTAKLNNIPLEKPKNLENTLSR